MLIGAMFGYFDCVAWVLCEDGELEEVCGLGVLHYMVMMLYCDFD